jgi:peptide deformylase
MAIREILEVPDPRLKTVSDPVATFDDSLKALVADMFETMYAANGIGLAAIQVGEPMPRAGDRPAARRPRRRARGVPEHGGHHHTHQPTRNEPRVFVNPEILDPAEELNTYQEGCLSVPEIYADVDRPKACRVRWQDLEGRFTRSRWRE